MEKEKPKILLVDDDFNVLEMIYDGLIAENYEVISASTPTEALKKVKFKDLDFALLDLDLGWNHMTGIELGQELRNQFHDLIIIIMTGYHNIKFAVEAMRKYGFHYMIKPFRIDQIISLTERAKRELLLEQENTDLKKEVNELKKEIQHLNDILDKIRPQEAERNLGNIDKDLSQKLKSANALNSYERQKAPNKNPLKNL